MNELRTLLVVDDDHDVRQLLRELLELEGFHVETAGDGQEALAYLGRCATLPDAILLDLRMPGMNGWEFRTQQRADPRLALIPTYVLTADRTQNGETVARLQPAGLFHKPLDLDPLLDALARLPLPAGVAPAVAHGAAAPV